MLSRKRLYRLTLYLLAFLFPLWLFFLSDIFFWTYTPVPRLFATSIPALIIPILLLLERTIPAIISALLFAVITWLPLLFLWLQPVPEWVQYR